MCIIDAQLIFYPLATFCLVFFGIKMYKRYYSTKNNIVTKEPDSNPGSTNKKESASFESD